MTRILLFLAVVVRSVYQTGSNERITAAKLGENCRHNLQCHQRDTNSECAFSNNQQFHLISICSCKAGYRAELVNNTEKCVVVLKYTEEEKEGLTAAPIILCFMGCVIVEAFCLLAFRYWKKRRRNRMLRQDTLNLEATLGTSTPRTPQHIFLPLLITQVESSVIESGENSPPPYSQTAEAENAQSEEPPPTYEEAMKQSDGAQSLSPVEESEGNEQRKMSC